MDAKVKEVAQEILDYWTPEHFCRLEVAMKSDGGFSTVENADKLCILGVICKFSRNQYDLQYHIEQAIRDNLDESLKGISVVNINDDHGQEPLRDALQRIVQLPSDTDGTKEEN